MWEDYAHERARNFATPVEEERAVAARQRAQLVPDELRTRGQRFWTVVAEDGAPVGVLWVAVEQEKRQAFIYDIEIEGEWRGRGYGRQTLDALESELRPLGVRSIGLNVFGDNAVAMDLYRKVGYRTVATTMRKEL
jgi:ribosomal protein S18 acetylase RimI-like enzyme